LNCLFSLRDQDLVQDREVIKARKIRHLAAEKSRFKRQLRSVKQLRAQGIVSNFEAAIGVLENGLRQGLPSLLLNLLIEELLCFRRVGIDPVSQ
jgi:hypothetical protein